jgi:N-acyl-D-amino-acid deacylase
MREITRREMEAGAFGLSTGLIYMPCAYAETAELIELCKVVAEFDGCLSSCISAARRTPS